MTAFTAETGVERRLAALVRQRVDQAIAERGRDWAKEQLGISGPAIEALLWETTWTVDRAINVAATLGLIRDSDVERLIEASPA